jgi:hypothetical protein
VARATGPSLATIKRLFAVSGNLCAFRRCSQPLVHESKVTGRICHISAASAGGPRFDAIKTDDERHAFENLILMCPIHHDVIDSDPVAYSVEQLTVLKAEAEARHGRKFELSDSAANQFLVNLQAANLSGASVVITHNQSGGQAANVINNFGPPKRVITPAMEARVREVLATQPPGRIGFASTQGDAEAHDFKIQLVNLFRSAGWTVSDMQTFMFFGSAKGLVVTIPFNASEQGEPQVIAHALAQTTNPVEGNRGDMANDCGTYVQVWHAP